MQEIAHDAPTMSRFEMSRIVGLRAMQLESGVPSTMRLTVPSHLRDDVIYIAARELEGRQLDIRFGESQHDARSARLPPELFGLLDTKDGGTRGLGY